MSSELVAKAQLEAAHVGAVREARAGGTFCIVCHGNEDVSAGDVVKLIAASGISGGIEDVEAFEVEGEDMTFAEAEELGDAGVDAADLIDVEEVARQERDAIVAAKAVEAGGEGGWEARDDDAGSVDGGGGAEGAGKGAEDAELPVVDDELREGAVHLERLVGEGFGDDQTMALVKRRRTFFATVIAVHERSGAAGEERVGTGAAKVFVDRAGPGVADAATHIEAAEIELAVLELNQQGVVPDVGGRLNDIDTLEVAVHAIGEAIDGRGVSTDLVARGVVDSIGDGVAERADVGVADADHSQATIEGPAYGERGLASESLLDAKVALHRVGGSEVLTGVADAAGTGGKAGAGGKRVGKHRA
jgi:hypothetical protein